MSGVFWQWAHVGLVVLGYLALFLLLTWQWDKRDREDDQ